MQLRIRWTTAEKQLLVQEMARIKPEFESRDVAKLLARAQLVLPAARRRPTQMAGQLPKVGGLNKDRQAFVAQLEAYEKAAMREAIPCRVVDPEASTTAMPVVTSVQDELANYGLADLLAATLTRLLEAWQAVAPAVVQATTQIPAPIPQGVRVPYVDNNGAQAARDRKVRIAGIGFLPSQQAAIQLRVPEVDFTWIDADQSQTYVPPSMDFALMSRFCQHRWSEHCWRTFGQARAPRVTGGISEAAQTVRMLLHRQGVNGTKA